MSAVNSSFRGTRRTFACRLFFPPTASRHYRLLRLRFKRAERRSGRLRLRPLHLFGVPTSGGSDLELLDDERDANLVHLEGICPFDGHERYRMKFIVPYQRGIENETHGSIRRAWQTTG